MSSGTLLTSGAVLLQTLLTFLFVQFFALFCSFRTYKWSQIFCLWSCTLEQILAYPINNFLILCYHSKLLRVMLNTFCSNIKKKGNGTLRHNAQSLKRIARLPAKDRIEILRALRKTVKKRKGLVVVSMIKVTYVDSIPQSTGSQVSVNNDWMNWLVLHGNKNKAVNDVCEIGKAMGLKFKGDNNNMFDVLSGAGRKNKEGDGGGK